MTCGEVVVTTIYHIQSCTYAGVFVCLEQSATDLHKVQVVPLPPHRLLFHQNLDWFNLSGAGLPRLYWNRGH